MKLYPCSIFSMDVLVIGIEIVRRISIIFQYQIALWLAGGVDVLSSMLLEWVINSEASVADGEEIAF